MEKLSAAQVSSLYGVTMAEYGGEGGTSPMMALMTHPQHGAQAQGVDENIITIVPGAFSSFNGQPECLVSATPKATATAMFHADKFQQLMPADQAAAARSVSSPPFVKTEGFPNLGSCFEFHTAQTRNCFAELSPGVIGLHPTEADTSHFSINRIGAVSNHEQEAADAMKAKISAHPQYPRLLGAYLDCQKVGAPAEVVARLDEVREEYEKGRNRIAMGIGMDPELDRFMEAYCEMLVKYHEELTKPFKEAMAFFKKIETQLNSLSKGTTRISPSAENEEKAAGGRSSDEGDCSTGEMDYQEVDHHPEERELKDRLLRKYSGYLGSLKQEFMKKKKKGKLPKDARQKLLDWWTIHYKWPYPSETEKVALAELTGLDQKQINNWFINQRKRHWKPSEEMQFVVMDGHAPHDGAYFVERHLMAEGPAFHFDC